jgi:hypothetical protein
MNERELLVDCLCRLNRIGVEYYLTGSMASNYWGIPRSTHDLDFVIQLSVSAVSVIVQEFSDQFYIDESAVRAAFQPPHQFNAIDTRSALKIDFWLVGWEPFDQEILRRRRRINLFGEPAWIATSEDVILHKLFWNRLTPSDRQLGDAALIVAVQAERLDTAYLRKWAEQLDVTEQLDRLLGGEIRPKSS